jgi:hypothetical protein
MPWTQRTELDECNENNDGQTVSNLERFQSFVYSEGIDIVFVNETWLSGETM